MFTGIIESQGTIESVLPLGSGKTFWIRSALAPYLKVDQSLSHDGVCLTVEEIKDGLHRVTAIAETLAKSTLGSLVSGAAVNLERCMLMNGRLDGHIVQGHVDATATCITRTERDGSWEFEFEFPVEFSHLIVEKGSVSVNGVSLTLFNVKKNRFTIAIIPYTFNHTNIRNVVPGSVVNIEFDLIGKYVARLKDLEIAHE